MWHRHLFNAIYLPFLPLKTGDMGSTENDAANLLDWTDVNDELEILHKVMSSLCSDLW